MDYDDLAAKARPALITASMRRSMMTYGELARAIDLDPNVPLSHHIRRVLDVVTQDCIGRKEPLSCSPGRQRDVWRARPRLPRRQGPLAHRDPTLLRPLAPCLT